MCLPVIGIVLVTSFAICGENVVSATAEVTSKSRPLPPPLVLNAEGGLVTTDGLSSTILNDGSSADKQNSHVKPRKEALLNMTSPEVSSISSEQDKNSMRKPSKLVLVSNTTNTISETTEIPPKPAVISNSLDSEKKNRPPEHVNKKPLMLSYDALNNVASKILQSSTLHDLKSSLNPIDSDQIPSPNEELPNKSFYSNITARSPSLLIPILITLLVLPVVAVLGYVGLKRGKEAWKNRHYKRMDFLLDGMYNE